MPGTVKINPSVFTDKRDAVAVAVNEALRIFMEDSKFVPNFEVTPAQLAFFKDTAYNPARNGEAADDVKGGNVIDPLLGLGAVSPRPAGLYAAPSPTDAQLYPKTGLRSTIPTPLEAANEATGNQIPSDNAAVNLVNQFIAGAGTFGSNRKGSNAGGPIVPVHEFEGKVITKAAADLLRSHTTVAEQNMRLRAAEKGQALQMAAEKEQGPRGAKKSEGGIQLRKPAALEHHTEGAGPQGFTYDPGRAYRRVGGIEGLRDIVDVGELMASPVAKENPLNHGRLTFYGRKVFFKEGHPEVAYPGPITVEMDSNASTAPGRYEEQAPTKRFSGFINAEGGEGTALSSISRILHDDGTVIYSRERDRLSGLLSAVNKHLVEQGAQPVAVLGEGRAARDAAIRAVETAQAQEQAEAKARADRSGLTVRLMKR